MLTTNVHPKLGRIVATTKPDKGLSVTAGEFSVLLSDGFFSTNVDETRNNGMRNTSTESCALRRAAQYGELRFYVTEEDAMEESAYLVGKREGELPGVTATRRARSTGGQTFRMDTNHMGRLGIGLVAGVINSAGTRSGRPDAANPVPDGEAWAVAIAAVEALKPSYLGTVIDDFMFTAADGTTDGHGGRATQ